MGFKKKIEVKVKSDSDLFEDFMIEIGQYKMVGGQLEISGSHIPKRVLMARFLQYKELKTKNV